MEKLSVLVSKAAICALVGGMLSIGCGSDAEERGVGAGAERDAGVLDGGPAAPPDAAEAPDAAICSGSDCATCDPPCPAFTACGGGECRSCVDGFLDVRASSRLVSPSGDLDRFAGSCARAAGPELVRAFTAPAAGDYVFDSAGSVPDTAVYLLRSDCAGVELSCDAGDAPGAPGVVIARLEAGESVAAVVEVEGNERADVALSVRRHAAGQGCCAAGGEPGCEDARIASCVCDRDPDCCLVAWDALCAEAAADPSCGGCPRPACSVRSLGEALPITVSGDTTQAPDAVSGSCDAGASPELLYRFTSRVAGTYLFESKGSEIDTVLYLLDGSCDGPELECNDDAPGFSYSSVALHLDAGQEVVVAVEGRAGARGKTSLIVTRTDQLAPRCCRPGPGPGCGDTAVESCVCEEYPWCCTEDWSESCAEQAYFGGCTTCAVPRTEACAPETVSTDTWPLVLSGDTFSLSNVTDITCGDAGGTDVVYAFDVVESGRYSFDASDVSIDVALAVLDGGCGGAELGCTSMQPKLALDLDAGQRVVVVLEGKYGLGGYYEIRVSRVSTDVGQSCCTESTKPGCSDPVVEACVCAELLFDTCCADVWDDLCAAGVEAFGCGTCAG